MAHYCPPRIYRNGHSNTLAAASTVRKAYAQQVSQPLRKQSESLTLELSNAVRLQGLLNGSQISKPEQRPLVMILHGWLGCANSLYLLPLASALHQKGFNVFRLNLRDHGGTQHLNKELFHSCRLEEVLQATEAIQQQVPHSDFYLIGFSLGGNFALRIGAQAYKHHLEIKKIFSICPVMDPSNALNKMETMLNIYTAYYLRRWKNMLRKKHQLFPDDYDLQSINQQGSLIGMTEHLLLQYTEFDSVENYLNGYSIIGAKLKPLTIPSEVFIAEDDPVIPARDREKLYATASLKLNLTQFGGHCGYLKGLFNMNWVDEQIIRQLTKEKN